ncbi:MAG: D-alanyl-D-alanine carboxypeptidase [Bacteroidales bacterium]|nr:D-alanyl-D-alanine carboxypeptidase [Bacteroidales bacterium]
MRKSHILISVALLLSAWSATAVIRTDAQQTIARICEAEPLSSSLVGVCALRMDGDTVAAVNIRRKLVPASNIKLLTTGLALNALGPDYRFETRLAYAGEIVDGCLRGDLYILGGGDPTTGSKVELAAPLSQLHAGWMQMLTDAGIRSIEGRVLGDPRFFSETTAQNLGWTYDDLGTNYGAGPLGLNFFENAQNFYLTPGPVGAPLNWRVQYPDTPWMQVAGHAVTGPARSSNTLYYVASPLAPVGEIAGSFPVDRRGYTLESANLFGAFTCAYYFYNYLRNNGLPVEGGYGDVSLQGEVRTDLAPGVLRPAAALRDSLVVLGATRSAALSEIVKETNCQSNNFYAETLLRMVALSQGLPTDQDGCQKAAETAMRALGLRTDNACRQVDGSGLSRKNYVSPGFYVRFLRKMATLPVWEAYFQSLPVPGGDGTLENRFRDAPQEFKDRIHMKSGSMNGVLCYSGYILSGDGDPAHTIAFSLLVNNCTASTYVLAPVLESIIAALAAENE